MDPAGVCTNQKAALDVALPRVFKILRSKEGSEYRSVSKQWRDSYSQVEEERNRLVLKVCGKIPASMDVFKSLPKNTPIRGFRFEDLDVGNLLNRSYFMEHHVQYVKTLEIVKCKLYSSRFYEILGHCKSLKTLEIVDSPSIFIADKGFGSFLLPFSFAEVGKNLANLDLLGLEGSNLSHTDIWAILKPMKNLKCLHVNASEGRLPIVGLNEALGSFNSTLKCLTLKGIIPPDHGFGRDKIEMTKLEQLQLLGNQIHTEDGLKKLKLFLNNCPALHNLHIHQSFLGEGILPHGVLERLTCLELGACLFGPNTFYGASFSNLKTLTLSYTMPNEMNSQMKGNTEKALKMLLGINKPKLLCLNLELQQDSRMFLDYLDPEKYPRLERVWLKNCNDISAKSLGNIFKLKSLRTLDLEDSNEICDDTLTSGDPSLKDLKDLKSLSLICTNVTNDIVTRSILALSKLESINLSGTMVNKRGLEALLTGSVINLPRLREVTMLSLTLPVTEYQRLRAAAPQVEIYCVIGPDSGTPSYIS